VNININQYRYGHNAQEKNNEQYGNGNLYTAEFWEYDPRLCRRWNTDPLKDEIPRQSPYSVFNNNPLHFIDPSGAKGEDWFYYQAEGESKAEWHWHQGSTYNLQTGTDASGQASYTTLQGYESVVTFEGDRNEKTGPNDILGEPGSISAKVTLYGPGGANDIHTYDGFTMTSTSPTYNTNGCTPIDEGVYKVFDRGYAKYACGGVMEKRFEVTTLPGSGYGSGQLPTLDGQINNWHPGQVTTSGLPYKDGILIHNTCSSDKMGTNISTGCLIIPNSQYKNSQGTGFYDIMVGTKNTLLILTRAGSTHNPELLGPKENKSSDNNAWNGYIGKFGTGGLLIH
jgi:hypothetical protein